MEGMKQGGPHPARDQLERLMRVELPRDEARAVVRHILTGCSRCVAVTRRLWLLGEPWRRHLVSEAGIAEDGGAAEPSRGERI